MNPSMVVPWFNELQDAGIEARMWLGVWGHAYPDRVDEHRNVRWDWAEETVRWFDFHLKGEGERPPLDVEVEDSLFVWRREASYPPRDAAFVEFPSPEGAVARARSVAVTTEPLDAALRVAGLPQLHFTATPTTATGGHLFAELYDVFPDGRAVRIGWGAINLRFAAGGNTEPVTLVPGQPVDVKMEFEPVDALVGEGHRLRVVVHKEGAPGTLPSPDPSVVLLGEGVLRLPSVERPNVVPSYEAPGLAEP